MITYLELLQKSMSQFEMEFQISQKSVSDGNIKYFVPTASVQFIMHPLSRPEGPRRCLDRGNAGGALVFFHEFSV